MHGRGKGCQQLYIQIQCKEFSLVRRFIYFNLHLTFTICVNGELIMCGCNVLVRRCKVSPWIPWNLSFRYILLFGKTHFLILAGSAFCQIWLGRSADCTHSIGQFTPKMKANAKPHLLSSLVWIDHYNECNRLTTLIIFGKNALPANIRKLVYSWNRM